MACCHHIRYCITLDSDTRLPRDAARTLIGIIAHPLNRPVFDPRSGRVTEGYGVLQPRISVTFTSAAGSLFARLYAGQTGVDPYTTAVSDTYQDLFGEGIFTGKGLYDVDAFNAALADSVPENTLLSHDLFEGLHARVGLVSDVELADEYPSSVLTHARRQHRWIRGDWQILFWLFPFVPSRRGWKRNTLPIIGRWKILDNLRRSLVSPTLLALLVAGWTALPGPPWNWTVGVLLVLASQLLPIVASLVSGPTRAQSLPVFFRNLGRDALTALAQILLSLTFLAFHAFDSTHAIGLTLVRLVVTKRRLLEWETAASSAAKMAGIVGQSGLYRFSDAMIASPVIATAVALAIVAAGRPLGPAAPFLLLWMLAPAIAYRLSRPMGHRVRPLGSEEKALLRRTARKTWRYFDTFVNATDAWLPPDNYQETEAGGVAHRTSPTNIGMTLLSMLAAYDLGYISVASLIDRVDRTLGALESLERYRGHVLNWYDTATLTPLHPRYVSTVDSGNLAGALIALANGVLSLTTRPQTHAQRAAGLEDAARLLATASSSSREGRVSRETYAAINRLARAIVHEAQREPSEASLTRLRSLATELVLLNELDDLPEQFDDAGDLVYWRRSVLDAIGALSAVDEVPVERCLAIARRASQLVDEMRFDFLYDRRKRIFAIGYRLADAEGPGRPDGSFYDLLASEARLASFVAISKGDVPQHHWFHLGRPVTNVNGRATLVSWGGTMFEYLMPMLLMRTFPGTLLHQSSRACVQRQIDYARRRGAPWGISESAYAFTDRAGHYQYQAFGVPGLGLRRGLANDLVIAPYATALAALVNPAAAADNFKRLAANGLDGRFGYYEALDYRPRARDIDAAPDEAAPPAVVRAFFAHHQGMSLIALANVLCDDAFVRRFHADPRIEASELLLQERVPREAILSEPRPVERSSELRPSALYASRRFRSPHTAAPHTQFLSNGRYTVALSHVGGGYSSWMGQAITRQRMDRSSDAGAHYIFLRDPWSGHVWSPTYQPVCQEPESYEATFDLDKVTFSTRNGDFETQLQITVSSEDDVEVRRLSIVNRGSRPREIEVTSFAEIALARPEDDLAHPGFGKLFIETEFDPQSSGLLFSRRPRSSGEEHAWVFHVLGIERRLGGAVEWETDRARFIGRGRSPANPLALEGRALSGTTGAVLDPVASLRDRVRLAPGAVVRVTFATGVATDRDTALALARKYRDGNAASRAFSMAFTHVHTTLMHLGLTDDHAILFDRLASRLLGADASCISPPDIAANTLGQSGLWGYGISGDLPIALVRITEANALPLVRQLLLAQEYWRLKGLRADVVILNEHPAEYLDETQNYLSTLVQEARWAGWNNRPGGMYLLRADGMAEVDRRLLAAVARVVLVGDRGDLDAQLSRPAPWLGPGEETRDSDTLRSPAPSTERVAVPPLVMENGIGGFTSDGRDYVIVLDGDRETPLPWSNVLANPEFGTLLSASGAAFTWAGNSRENRVTPFANDPISDPTGEAIYIRDDESGEVWGATPGPLARRPDGGRWVVRHSAGVTRYQHVVANLEQELAICVSPDDPVKLAILTITNRSESTRRLSVFGYVEWCLGPPQLGIQRFVTTEFDQPSSAIFASNVYNSEFRDRVAFFHATQHARSFTCDRAEFIGRNRTARRPLALVRDRLVGRVGAGLDPCGALQLEVVLAPIPRIRSPSFSDKDATARTPARWSRNTPRSTSSCRRWRAQLAPGTTCWEPSR